MNECPECNAMLQVGLESEDESKYYTMVYCNHCGYRMPMIVEKEAWEQAYERSLRRGA